VGVAKMVNNIILDLQLTVLRLQLKPEIAVIYHHGVVGVDGVRVMVVNVLEVVLER